MIANNKNVQTDENESKKEINKKDILPVKPSLTLFLVIFKKCLPSLVHKRQKYIFSYFTWSAFKVGFSSI